MKIQLQLIYIIFIKISLVRCLTCDEVLELPPEKKLTLTELQTISPKDVVQCIAHLGKIRLPLPEAQFIWQSVKKFYEEVSLIPDEILMLLKWITVAISPEDYNNMSIHDIDVIQNFGQDYNLNKEQLAALAARVREDFSSKDPEDYTNFDLIAIGQILCAYNKSDIERIHPSSYRDAAFEIGNLNKCSDDTMSAFAALAVQVDAFGPIEGWNVDTVMLVGKVGNYLPLAYLNKFHIAANSHHN